MRKQQFKLSKLDHFTTTDKELYACSRVITCGATDHYIIFGTRKKPTTEQDKDKYYGRAYGKLDRQKFKYDVLTHDWDAIYTTPNPNEAWNLFKSDFLEILDKHAPYKYFNSRKDRQPWVTNEYLESVNERDNLRRQADRTGDLLQDRMAKNVRNRCVSLKRELKRLFFQTSIAESAGDNAKLWKTLKRFLQTTTKSNQILNINGKTTPNEIADEINNYFTNIGEELANKIGNSAINLDYAPNH